MWNEIATLTFPVLFGDGSGRTGDPNRAAPHFAREPAKDAARPRPATANADDLASIARIREGTEGDARREFDLLYARLFERLFKFALRMTNDSDSARDVVQDAFVALWVTRANWHAPGGSVPYLYTAVRNQALMRTRHQRVRERANPAKIPTPSAATVPDVVVERDEFALAFRDALEALPERRRNAFLLHAVDGLSYDAIGQVIGISKPAAFKQVSAAIAILRRRLAHFAG